MLVRLDRKTLRCCDLSRYVNVPMCELFTILDSRYFYTTKSLWVGDFGAGTKKINIYQLGLINSWFIGENICWRMHTVHRHRFFYFELGQSCFRLLWEPLESVKIDFLFLTFYLVFNLLLLNCQN
jgi:hypothetical protein